MSARTTHRKSAPRELRATEQFGPKAGCRYRRLNQQDCSVEDEENAQALGNM